MRVGDRRIGPGRLAVIAQGGFDPAVGGLEVSAGENRVGRREPQIRQLERGSRFALASESGIERGEVAADHRDH